MQDLFYVPFTNVNEVFKLVLPKTTFLHFLHKISHNFKFQFRIHCKIKLSLFIYILFGKLISYSITISKVYILRWINSHSILSLVWCGYFISRQPNNFFLQKQKIWEMETKLKWLFDFTASMRIVFIRTCIQKNEYIHLCKYIDIIKTVFGFCYT